MDVASLLSMLARDWPALAAIAGFFVLQSGLTIADIKDQARYVVAYLKSWLPSKASKVLVSDPERSDLAAAAAVTDDQREAALLSLRFLASELPPAERTDALLVMDQTDLLHARVREREEPQKKLPGTY